MPESEKLTLTKRQAFIAALQKKRPGGIAGSCNDAYNRITWSTQAIRLGWGDPLKDEEGPETIFCKEGNNRTSNQTAPPDSLCPKCVLFYSTGEAKARTIDSLK